MGNVLRVAAAVQMGLGGAGFVTAFAYYLLALGQPGSGRDFLVPLVTVALSTLVFTAGGVLWSSVRTAYPPPKFTVVAPPRDPDVGGPAMAVVVRVVSLAVMTYGAVGFAAVGYLWVVPGFVTGREWRGLEAFVAIGLSLLAMLTVGLGGLLWVGGRLAYPAPPATPAPEDR